MKANTAIAVVVVLTGIGVLVWFVMRKPVLGQGITGGVVTAGGVPQVPGSSGQAPAGSSGPSTGQIVGTAVATGTQIAGIVAGIGGAGAAVAGTVAPAAITASGAVGAAGTAVGGSTVAGSVAATQGATAAAGANSAAGSAVAGGGVGLGTVAVISGIGAAFAIGYFIWRANRNDTKEDREDFVESLKSITVNGVTYPMVSDATGTQFDHLHAAMLAVDPTIGEQLWIEATQQIGKKDRTRNVAWMHKVLQLFGLEQLPAVQAGLPYDAPFADEEQQTDDQTGLLELMA